MEGAREFKRELKLLDATMIVVGSMIGSGIFIVSADIARTVGSGGLLLVVWLLAGLMTVVGALSYGELAGMMPRAGGQYVYLRESFGPMIGFLYGWTFFMVIQTGTIAAVGVAFAKFTSVLIPGLGEDVVVGNLSGFKVNAAQIVGIISILLLTAFNTRGIHGGRILQNVFTSAKTAALLGLIIVGALIGTHADVIAQNLSSAWHAEWTRVVNGQLAVTPLEGMGILAAIGVAMVGSLFSSDAWNNITFAAGEVVEPERTIPRSLVLGTSTVILLYLAANVVYLSILPLSGTPAAADVAGRGIQFATSDRVGTAAASLIFGTPGTLVMAILIVISTFGCNNGLILAGARVYYAMARDGLFFRSAGRLNRFAVPGAALTVQAFWACLLCLSGTYGDLLDYVIFAVLIFYALTVAGIFVLRKKRPDAVRPYRAPGYPLLPFVYIIAALAVAVDLLFLKPQFTWPGLVIVCLGIPVYVVWNYINSHKKGAPQEPWNSR
jgi:basic amino acid/polyamine antiporter, APA family